MKTKHKIYVLDDCDSTTFILQKWLENFFSIETFNTPSEFLNRFNEEKPHLCILDVQLNANRNGIDVLKEIKFEAKKASIPFVFISQDALSFSKANAYELGAVDFLKKPLDKQELQHKVNNIISLIYPEKTGLEKHINLDEGNLIFTLMQDDQNVHVKLTPKEFIVFRHLFKNKNNIVTRDQILSSLENHLNEKFVVDRVVDVHVCNIKKKLGRYKNIIDTVYGVGYKFDSTKIAS